MEDLVPVPTSGPQTAAGIARECIARGADLIVVAGGDGTINEVVNGMAHSDIPIGVLPGGTANVLAVELGLGCKLEPAAQTLAQSVPERISLGLLRTASQEPRYFALMTGAGLDAHIVYNVSARLKSAMGKAAYWVGGIIHGMRILPEFTAEVNGREYRASFALVTRVRNYGGDLEIARRISLLDDDFEVVLFQGVNPLRYMKYLAAVMLGTAERLKGVTVLRAECVKFLLPEDRRIYVQIDGEFAGPLPATVEIVPHALTLLVPPAFAKTRAPAVSAWTTSPTR